MNILDGKTGLPLLAHPIVDSVGSQMGGLSLSVEGKGTDWFLYWTANCIGHEGVQTPFSFAKGVYERDLSDMNNPNCFLGKKLDLIADPKNDCHYCVTMFYVIFFFGCLQVVIL